MRDRAGSGERVGDNANDRPGVNRLTKLSHGGQSADPATGQASADASPVSEVGLPI
jgi:hypothetical protein